MYLHLQQFQNQLMGKMTSQPVNVDQAGQVRKVKKEGGGLGWFSGELEGMTCTWRSIIHKPQFLNYSACIQLTDSRNNI